MQINQTILFAAFAAVLSLANAELILDRTFSTEATALTNAFGATATAEQQWVLQQINSLANFSPVDSDALGLMLGVSI
jgi:hypothetical protein